MNVVVVGGVVLRMLVCTPLRIITRKLLKISVRIAFYNKSTLEHLCTLNTATLSMRTHLAPMPAQNTLNHVRGHSRSRILGSLKSRRRTTYYCIIRLIINIGFRVGNFEGKVSAFPFSRIPLSFGTPYLGNPCNYSHKPYTSVTDCPPRNYLITFCLDYRQRFLLCCSSISSQL